MSAKKASREELSFEQAIARLEEIVELMDDPQTPLEQMIALVEEGLALRSRCDEMLKSAQLRIERLENPDAQPQPRAPRDESNPAAPGNDFSLLYER